MSWPVCIGCGKSINAEISPHFTPRKCASLYTTAKLARRCFKVPWVWGTFTRALIPDNQWEFKHGDSSRHQFQLTGVGQVGYWDDDDGTPAVPLDKNRVLVGPSHKQKDCEARDDNGVVIVQPQDSPAPVENIPLATFIHERCWQLAKRVLGGSAVEENLNIFVESCNDICIEADDEYYIVNEYLFYDKAIDDFGLKHVLRYPEECLREYRIYWRKDERRIFNRDPVQIPELQELIGKAVGRRRKDQKKEQGFTAGQKWKHRLCPIASALPLDIQYLITGTLCCPNDINNLLKAFQWQLPNKYWRQRFPRNVREVIYELDQFQDHELNWKRLYWGVFGAEGLLKTSHGFRYRQWIINRLKLVRPMFLETLEKHVQK